MFVRYLYIRATTTTPCLTSMAICLSSPTTGDITLLRLQSPVTSPGTGAGVVGTVVVGAAVVGAGVVGAGVVGAGVVGAGVSTVEHVLQHKNRIG